MIKDMSNSGNTVWKIARIQRAKNFPAYRSRAMAAADIGVSESTLSDIETGTRNPQPDEVWAMSEIYGAPELRCLYCHDYCRLGADIPKAENGDLDRISIKAYGALKKVEGIKDSLMDVVADGKITPDERPTMDHILEVLDQVSQVAQNLRVCLEKSEIERKEDY